MGFPYFSQRDLRFIQLYDAYNYSCVLYEKAMNEYNFYKPSKWQDKAKLAEEKLEIAKQNMEDAKKEFVEFARIDKR